MSGIIYVQLLWHGAGNESSEKAEAGKKKSPAAPDGTRTRDLSITSPAIHHWAIPAPQFLFMHVKWPIITDKKKIKKNLKQEWQLALIQDKT